MKQNSELTIVAMTKAIYLQICNGFSIYFASVWLVDTAPFSNFVALTTHGPQN